VGAAVSELFHQLGITRDRDVIASTIVPMLREPDAQS